MIKCKIHTLKPDTKVEEEPQESGETPGGPEPTSKESK